MPKRKFEQMTKQCNWRKSALRYDFMISLHKMAMAKIITTLWMNGDTQQYLEQYNSNSRMDFIQNKISALHLPSPFTRSLIRVFKSVEQSVADWIDHHSDIFDSYGEPFHHLRNIKWNSRGRIDYAETAKNILANMDNCIDDELRYRLACTYCLEDEIAVLAPKVVDTDYLDCVDESRYPMVHFWTAHITGDARKYPIASLFDTLSFRDPNEVSVMWTWNRLSAEEKSGHCVSNFNTLWIFKKDFHFFLLSTMNYEQQQVIFRRFAHWIFKGMLNDWLWEDYFLPTALHLLNIIKPKQYANILSIILFKIGSSQEEEWGLGDQYKPMFKLLWRETPMNMKDFALKHNDLQSELLRFSPSIQVDVLESVLKDFNAEQKKRLILGDDFYWHCMICNFQFELADYLMNWCEASPEEINDFKTKLMLSGHIVGKLVDEAHLSWFIKWCNPSKEAVSKFKQSVKSDYDTSPSYRLLDEFIENRS